jgi:hypothetical protein
MYIQADGIAQSETCLTADCRTRFRSPAEENDFSSIVFVQTSSEFHAVSYPVGTGSPFPGRKARPGRDADPSLPSSAEVKNE